MNSHSGAILWFKRALFIGGLILIVFSVYLVVSAITISATTGLLDINTHPRATISISQANHQSKGVGVGYTEVRLQPGAYQVVAFTGKSQAARLVTVTRHHTTSIDLNPSKIPTLPSVNDVDFENFDSLVNQGLTTQQISALQLDFFRYDTSAKKVEVDSSSVAPGPHNPNSDDPFTLNFSVVIDGRSLSAVVSYTGFTDIQLQLYNSGTTNLVFNSSG